MKGYNRLKCMNLWRWKCGLPEFPMPEEVVPSAPSWTELKHTQWCKEFEQLMRNRLVMGAFRYGLMTKGSGKGYDSVSSAIERLRMYQLNGNQEFLVDAANLCLVEYQAERHPNAHMEAVDDGLHVKENG